MTGSELIAVERQRQIESENWTAEHDDEYSNGELSAAASAYAYPILEYWNSYQVPMIWPFEQSWWKPAYKYLSWGPIEDITDSSKVQCRIRDLIKAGALIAAEVDRLQRVTVDE